MLSITHNGDRIFDTHFLTLPIIRAALRRIVFIAKIGLRVIGWVPWLLTVTTNDDFLVISNADIFDRGVTIANLDQASLNWPPVAF